jgi:hypothetical protein
MTLPCSATGRIDALADPQGLKNTVGQAQKYAKADGRTDGGNDAKRGPPLLDATRGGGYCQADQRETNDAATCHDRLRKTAVRKDVEVPMLIVPPLWDVST